MPRRPPCHRPPHRESMLSGWVVPARWTKSPEEREALRAANGVDVVQERATQVVVLTALVIVVLLVIRMAVG